MARHWSALRLQSDAMNATADQVRNSGTLGGVPLVVMSATAPTDELRRVWTSIDAGHATLSANGVHREVEGATHGSLAFDREDARSATESILQVVAAARTERPREADPPS